MAAQPWSRRLQASNKAGNEINVRYGRIMALPEFEV